MQSLGLRSLTKETIATAGKSVTGNGTAADPLQLVNDEINPGNSEYYGTDASGVKGFFPIAGGGGTPSDIPALPLSVTAAPGFSSELSRYDHVHPYPTPTEIGAQTSNANLTAFTAFQPTDFALAATSIVAGTGLAGGGNLSANRTLSVVNDTTIQQIQVLNVGTTVGSRSIVNFIPGGSLQISVSNNASSNRIDVLISAAAGGGGGPPLSNTVATSLGVASAGISTDASRADHVHPLPSVGDLGAVPTSRNLTAGTGLTGGGTLAADRTFALDAASIASLALADTAVQPARAINTGTGLIGGGNLSTDRTLSVVNDTTIQQVQVLSAGTTVGARSILNVTGGGIVQVGVSNNLSSNRIDINVSAPATDLSGYVPTSRTLTAGTGLTGGGNLTADRTFSVVNDTTIQQVQVLNAGTTVGARSMINIIGGGAVQVVTSANPSSNRIDITVSAPTGGSAPSYLNTNVFTFVVDGGVSAVTTGVKGDLWIPFTCSIAEWTILPDQSGSIQFDIWVAPYASYPPTVGNTITASAKPLISSGTKGQSSTLTGWSTSVALGNTMRINVDSCTSIQRATLAIRVEKK